MILCLSYGFRLNHGLRLLKVLRLPKVLPLIHQLRLPRCWIKLTFNFFHELIFQRKGIPGIKKNSIYALQEANILKANISKYLTLTNIAPHLFVFLHILWHFCSFVGVLPLTPSLCITCNLYICVKIYSTIFPQSHKFSK